MRHGISALHDTGSDVLTLFATDLTHLGIHQPYNGWLGYNETFTADGNAQHLSTVMVEIRMVRPGSHQPWGEWIPEVAVIRNAVPGMERLSGAGMRDRLYFGTPPATITLPVVQPKEA